MGNILQNINVKYVIIICLILYIATLNPPLHNLVSLFYNNIFGKILMLVLILYYANSTEECSLQIALLLTLLYVLLSNINNTQNNITSYGKLINNNLIGGNTEEDMEELEEDLLSSTEEDGIINDSSEEQDMDSKIDNIIQEEIVLNKSTYEKKMKDSRELGAKQYELNKSLEKAQSDLKKQKDKYQQSEEDYNTIMNEVSKYDTNKDGKIDFNDTYPEAGEEMYQEEMYQEELLNINKGMAILEGGMDESMRKLHKVEEDLNKLVSQEPIEDNTTGG